MAPRTGLSAGLAQRLRESGPLTVAAWMEHANALYYAKGDPLGAAGDFITAPEISQMFGELVGLWAAVVWRGMGAPARVTVAEAGPGRGTLMADFLRAAAGVPAFRDAIALHLVETSPALRRCQAETLAGTGGPAPVWHESPDSLPDGPLILIGNEFLDALPVHQFEKRHGAWHERRIALSDAEDALCLVLDPEPADPGRLPPGLADAAEGTVAETRPAAESLAAALGARLAAAPGVALFVDYGSPVGGPGDSLQAVRGHAAHPVLDSPGEADLTAHVDFAAVARAAQAHGAARHGPVPQGAWLRALGIEARAGALARARPDRRAEVETALARLIRSGEMGTLFQAMVLASPALPAPPGFESALAATRG